MNQQIFVEAKSNADIAPCLSVVVPVYNEEATATKVLLTVLNQAPVQDIIVVDDGSTDNAWQKFRQNPNQGKGAALRKGFE